MTASQRSVLHLMSGVEDAFGGNLRAAVNTAEAMADSGTDVTFSAPAAGGAAHRTVDLMDERVQRRLFPASRLAARFGGSVSQVWWIWRHVRTFDEVHTHSVFTLSAVYSILVCAARGVPIFLWPHGSLDPFDLRKHARVKRLLGPVVVRRLLDRCAALLFTTENESRIAVTYGSRTRREVVSLPVAPLDSAGADPARWRERHGVPAGVPVVLFVGRVDYKKRLPLLVEAMSLLENRAAHLVVVGDGPESERLLVAEAARRHRVADRVHVTGWLEGPDRIEAFLVGDVFALLSDAENFGLSVIEALSLGCPAVLSDRVDLAAPLELAGAAVSVEQEAAAAAAAIDRLLSDPAAAAEMGERARDVVDRDFAPPAVAARLREISVRASRAAH